MAQTQGKPPPSPIQYSLCLSTAPTSEWLFVPGLPRRSPEIVSIWTPKTLGVHNSFLRPLIEMKFKAKLQLSSRAFQRCVALRLQTPGSGRFLTFNGRESNCQFDSQPFFLHILCYIKFVNHLNDFLIYFHFAIHRYNYIFFSNIFFNHLISTSKWDFFDNFFFWF